MISRLEKFKAGIIKDPSGTLVKTVRFIAASVWGAMEILLFYAYRFITLPLPVRTQANLKHALNPLVKLDYSRFPIFLVADSELSIRRAHACTKEPETVKWIEEFLQPSEVLYDIGANVGAYSLVASKFLNGQVSVYAFEPSFSTYDQLCRNIILNQCEDNIFPYMIALAHSSKMIEFDYHSLDGGGSEHLLITKAEETQPHFQPVYRQRLLGFSMDHLVANFGFPAPHHIKLDVDGAEFAVLLGAEKIFQMNTVKSILVEVRREGDQADKVENLLLNAGFKIASRHDRGDGIIWNYIFTRNLD